MSTEKEQIRNLSVISTIIGVYAQKGADYDAQVSFAPGGVKIDIAPAKPQKSDPRYKLSEEEANNLFKDLSSNP